VDGQPLKHGDAKAMRALRQHVGMIFQSFNLFPHLSVGRNVMLAPTLVKQTDAAAAEAGAQAAGPRGPGREVRRLARPAVRRPAAARGHRPRAGHGPSVLLCDEITSALDPELVGEVLRVVETLADEGMTLLMVTHEMNFARKVADRVVFMHAGRIHEMGPPAELFGNPQTAELKQLRGGWAMGVAHSRGGEAHRRWGGCAPAHINIKLVAAV
jgi:polar amino acid transport system ATP-binding protein